MSDEIHIPLRDYLDDKDRNLRLWMSATFATKDDLGAMSTAIAVLDERSGRESRRVAATWGGAGTAIGAALVTVLAYFGIKPQQ